MVPLWSAVWRSDSEIQEFQVSQKTIISFFGLIVMPHRTTQYHETGTISMDFCRQWPNCPTKHLRSLWACPGPIERVYLGYPVEGLLELQVLPCLAGQVHPFALDPLHSGFTQKVFGLHLGDEVNVSALDVQRKKQVFMTDAHTQILYGFTLQGLPDGQWVTPFSRSVRSSRRANPCSEGPCMN